MRALGPLDSVRAWEWGDARHPVDRALVLLGLALPAWRREALAALPLGRRDGALLQLRALTLGGSLEVFSVCRKCKGELEFSVAVADLVPGDPLASLPDPFVVEHGEERARCRLPDSRDMATLAGALDRGVAARALLQRCVLSAERGGAPAPAGALSDDLLAALAARVAEEDPLAAIRFEVSCPACGHAWTADLDVVAYFWEEITAQVKRLVRDVHQLASAYAWSECEILSMSPARRRWYLDLLQ